MTAPPLSRQTVSLYAAAVGPVAILGLPFSVLLPPFITEGGMIAVGLVGLIFSIATIWDGVVDPGIGTMVDRMNVGSAPHRRWMQLASPMILLLLAILVFAGDRLSFLPLLVLLVLFTSSASLFDVAHLAWGSALADNKEQSSRLFGAREWAGKIFVLLAFAAPALAQIAQPNLRIDGQIIAYATLAALALPLALWAASRTPARAIVRQPTLGWRQEWLTTVKFRALVLLIVAQALNAFGLGAMTSLFVFYSDGVLGLDNQGPVLLLITFVGGVIMTPLWTRLAIKIGKPKGMLVMSLWLITILFMSLLLPRGDMFMAALFVFALGSGFVGLLFIYGITADLAAVDQTRCGRDRTGFIFAIVNLTQKVGTALAIGIGYAVLDWMGFVATNASASATLLRLLYVALPAVAWIGVIIAIILLMRQPEIQIETQER
jgi:glycoside/pentoside/hexuronide:cation symporter, GPH family